MNTETNRIEYKQELTDDLEKEAVAFLNYREGGLMYIGVTKEGFPIGVTDMDGDMLKIKDRLRHNILPSCMGLFDICVEELEGKDIIKIIFASGMEKPYYIKKQGMSEKGCYIRVGTAAEPMPVKIIESLFAKRTRNTLGRIKSPQQRLTFEQLKIYYEGVGKTLNRQFASNLELLAEDGAYNYVGYLLADSNNISIKVAKYKGVNRVNLIENNDYGFCSLIKATKLVLDKVEIENKTLSQITSKERIDHRLWNAVALREVVVNAMVHNDFTYEVSPKFEFFDDRIEITSYGGLPQGLSEEEFFEGFSLPRNKELMRVFRDVDLVEFLGSGLPRILESYGTKCFKLSDNFLRVILPVATEQDTEQDNLQTTSVQDIYNKEDNANKLTEQDTEQVRKLILILEDKKEESLYALMEMLGLKHRPSFLMYYLNPAMKQRYVEMTIPDRPTSKQQKYRITPLGLELKKRLMEKKGH
jgi:predicted HTH transcriptional regulator